MREQLRMCTEYKAMAGLHPAAETVVPSVLAYEPYFQIVGQAGPGEGCPKRL